MRCSHHVDLPHRPLRNHPLPAKLGQVERVVAPVHNQFGQGSPDGRRLLQAMAAESVGEQQIGQRRMWAHDMVVGQRIDVLMPVHRTSKVWKKEGLRSSLVETGCSAIAISVDGPDVTVLAASCLVLIRFMDFSPRSSVFRSEKFDFFGKVELLAS